jgi:hypothetical protein
VGQFSFDGPHSIRPSNSLISQFSLALLEVSVGIVPSLRDDARKPIVGSRSQKYLNRMLGKSNRGSNRSHRGSVIEALEPRVVLDAANLLISEFLASNSGGLRDEDGDSSDWLEIYNAEAVPVNLDGWYLSDNQTDLDKWAFPAQTLQPGEYLIVFTSGKDRAIVGSELHTNFSLSADGEYLSLTFDDPITGMETVQGFDPNFDPQTSNVSHGFNQPFNSNTLIGPSAPVQVLVPSVANGGSTLGNTWTQPGFTPTGWTNGTNGVGWQDGTDFNGLINTDVKAAMDGVNASAFVRVPFAGVDAATISNLQLDLNYDDGYIAYLNGTEIARDNAPAGATWNSAATSENGGVLAEVDFPNFTSTAGWAFNGNVAGSIPSITNNRLRVTPNVGSLGNSAFRSNPIPFDPTFYSFSTKMSIELTQPGGSSDPDGLGADGMTFVLQTDGPNRVGSPGGGLGLDGAFTQYVAIEFDTWNTGSFDPADGSAPASHVGINSSTAGGHIARAAVPYFNNGGVRNVWIDYDGQTDTMDVYFTTSATKPATPTLSAQVDLAAVFGGLPQLYAGFTAGTGGAFNTHEVVSWELTSGAGNIGASPQTIDITEYAHLLSPTGNVLAIHAMNLSASDNDPVSLSDRDFLVRPQLSITTVEPIDTSNTWYFDPSTPGAPNGIGTAAPSRQVQFSRESGTFVNAFQLTMSAAPGAEIRYTTNKTAPTATSTLYTGPITVTNSTSIRAISIEPTKAPSKPVTANYIALDASAANFQSNLPILVFDTFGSVAMSDRDLTYTGASIIEVGADGIARITDAAQYAGRGGIRLRGQTSQGFPKPPYAYETWNEDACVSRYGVAKGCNLNVSLLGMAEESDWVLNNPYSEKPLMQNQLAYHWSNEAGLWASKTRFVEVFANFNGDPKIRYSLTAANAGNVTLNDYLGVYLFMEKIKIDENRVAVDELETTDNAAPNITGGYIYKRDKVGYGDVPWASSRGIDYRLHDPDDGSVTAAQKSWLINYVNEMESVIYGANFTDPVNGYAKYLDVDSWVNHWIMVEMTKNIDGFRLSTYYTKERDTVDPDTGEVLAVGKVTMGPPWDYNLSLGNADYLLGNQPTGWYHSQSTTLNATTGLTEAEYIYFRRLFQDPNFKQKVVDRWQELREGVFSNANILADVNANIALLTNGNANPVATDNPALWTDAITRNFSRWRTIGTYLWPNGFVGTSWNQDVTWMRDTFLMPRLAWMDSQFLAKPLANQDGGLVPEGFQVQLTGPVGTQVYYTTDGSDVRTGGSVIPGTGSTTVMPSFAPLTYIVPTNDSLGLTWTQRTFDDAAWTSGTSGIGYERGSGYQTLIQTDLNAQMPSGGAHRGVYVRMDFNIDAPAAVNRLNLHFKYDDGFVAYLNGTEVARRNFTGTPTWNAGATQIHDDAQAVVFEDIDLTAFRNLLVAGNNVLAFAGYNDLATSSDLLFLPEIRINGTPDTVIPAGLSASAKPYTGPITIDENTQITARSYRSATGDFSGPLQETYSTQTIPFVITEINYNPADPSPAETNAGFTDNEMFEFIELRNVGATPLELEGMRVSTAVGFAFPQMTLAAGERVLVVRNQDAFNFRYGLGQNVAGQYSGNLANEGEQVRVLGPVGELTMDFTFSDQWHPLTDGEGSSLVIVNDTASPITWNDATSWRPSDYTNGSPGSADSSIAPAPGSIRINELLLDSPTGQRVELQNTSSAPVDVSGFYLTDNASNLTKYRLPMGLAPIAPGGYLVLNGATVFGANPLSLNGGRLILRAADASGTITGFETNEDFTAAEPNISQGWYIKSTGGHDFTPLTSATLGAANSGPRIGPVVINELMYHPAVGGDEFIELRNISASPVSLENWSLTGVTYAFGDTTLAADAYLLVVDMVPAAFRTKYSIPANVQIVGPYIGNLDNLGENVALSRPNATGGAVRVDRVNYNSSDDWPVRPQGIGSSLTKIDSTTYGNVVTSWAADATGGSPGSENAPFDDTPPTVPTGLAAAVTPNRQIVLNWNPSSDPQSFVRNYLIYRNDVLHATIPATATPSFTDAITDTNVTYVYQVAATNASNEASAKSAQVAKRILVVNDGKYAGTNQVRVNFNSVVTALSAQNTSNYQLPGLTVTNATLEAGGNSVLLTTSAQTFGNGYRVVVNGVMSADGVLIQPNATSTFVSGASPGLAAEYFNDPATNGQPNNDSLLTPNRVATRIDPNINYSWTTSSPIPGTVNVDYFSARWSGKLRTLSEGGYKFAIQGSDGMRVWVWPEGEARPATPTIDRWSNSTFNIFTMPNAINLAGNTLYNFVAEFYEVDGSASAFVRWITPGQTAAVPIPPEQLSVAVTVETTAPQVTEMFVASSDWTPAYLSNLNAAGLGNGGYKIPLGGNSVVLPYSNLNQVKVRFDSDVLVDAGDLSIAGQNVASYGIAGFHYDFATLTATWTLNQPIAFDRATITVSTGATDIVGNSLTGTRSGGVSVAAGDVNGDGTVNATDRSANLARQFTSIGHANYDLKHDLTGDGVINMTDVLMLQQRFGNSLPAGSAAAAAVVVHRATASAENSTQAEPIRARRAAAAVRQIAAVDRAIGQQSEAPSETSSKLSANRARRMSRASIDAVLGDSL